MCGAYIWICAIQILFSLIDYYTVHIRQSRSDYRDAPLMDFLVDDLVDDLEQRLLWLQKPMRK